MYQIQMTDENILVQKKIEENKSEFEVAGDVEKLGAVYEIKHIFADADYKVGDLVLLHPGSYEALPLNGEVFTTITVEDIIANVTEDKK